MQFLQDALSGKELGAKRGVFTPEDIEAYKYTFANYGRFTLVTAEIHFAMYVINYGLKNCLF